MKINFLFGFFLDHFESEKLAVNLSLNFKDLSKTAFSQKSIDCIVTFELVFKAAVCTRAYYDN